MAEAPEFVPYHVAVQRAQEWVNHCRLALFDAEDGFHHYLDLAEQWGPRNRFGRWFWARCLETVNDMRRWQRNLYFAEDFLQALREDVWFWDAAHHR